MMKKTLFIVLMASCGALGQRLDTPATVGRALGSQGAAAHAAPPASAHVEATSAPITTNRSNSASDTAAVDEEIVPEPKAGIGKRDPFVSPISTASGTPALPASNCASGKRCLVIDQLLLRGVVRTATGMIAVVANSVNKAYFLRENDPVFNGSVVRITGDSVVFKENTVDRVGHQSTREVVKRVTPPPA
ncbi:MAG TPA: hypothetical protein VMT05_06600 [Terriglobales bacterium]|jgi:hypothetical protein|nr:hypothetical protein [Terriglobales bacterium]